MENHEAPTDRQEQLEDTVVELKAEVERLRADLDRAVRAIPPAPVAPTPIEHPATTAPVEPTEPPTLGRRAAMRRAGMLAAGAVVGGAAIVAATPEIAAAATVTGSSTTGHGVDGTTSAANKAGVYGHATVGDAIGVWAAAGNASAVYATNASPSGTIRGLNSSTGPALYGTSSQGHGVQVFGQSNNLDGTQYGLRASSENVNLRLPAVSNNPFSGIFPFFVGDVFRFNSDLYLVTAGGTSPTFRKLGGPSTAGALHVLPTPVRAYDSRPGTNPSQGPKTKLAPNTKRSLTLFNAGVGNGATAALLTILLVNATAGNGNFTVWANGLATPASNTMVWGGNAGRFTATAVSGVDASANIQIVASLATDVVIDVVGYYR